jgi:Zn finger protein HypA/HybF involved in hydrogenase expression
MKKNKLEVIKKRVTSPCYCCNKGLYGKARPRKNCPSCKGTGLYVENHYYHIVTNKKGQKYCIDGDTIK